MSLPMEAIVETVRAAAELAVQAQSDGLEVKVKGTQDFVTHADREVEQFFRSRLTAILPGSEVLGEEFGGPTDADRLWIIDPIDGTTNFIRGLPHWCISLGLMEDGELRFGTILAPALGLLFVAQSGQGAEVNGRQLRRRRTDPASALVNIGRSRHRHTGFLPALVGALNDSKVDHRLLGSGALGLALTAAGNIDGAIEGHVNLWDAAAGFVIAREAGCMVNNFFTEGALDHGNPAVAAPPGMEEIVFGALEAASGEPVPRLGDTRSRPHA